MQEANHKPLTEREQADLEYFKEYLLCRIKKSQDLKGLTLLYEIAIKILK